MRAKTGASGNSILKKKRLELRNDKFKLEFDRACVRSFHDGATFCEVLKRHAPIRPNITIFGKNGAYLLRTFQKAAPS